MEFRESPEEILDDDLFEIRSAGEWFKDLPAEHPKMLFGDLWFESEIAVMYGESSVGKSILAVQISRCDRSRNIDRADGEHVPSSDGGLSRLGSHRRAIRTAIFERA
ncbi:MAG: hypothetical protein PSX80_14505 [bacterium]|nr:hypothetical protein [bacterium]